MAFDKRHSRKQSLRGFDDMVESRRVELSMIAVDQSLEEISVIEMLQNISQPTWVSFTADRAHFSKV
jgi:hypothetical protein